MVGTYSVNGGTAVTSTTVVPPEVPNGQKKTRGSSHSVSQGAHVDINVSTTASGALLPGAVSVPAGVAVDLRVTNHGGAADTVALVVPGHPSVHVGPGATGTLHTAGLKNGTYRILVNGAARGQLMIGAQGGP